MFHAIFTWLDANDHTKKGRLINQIIPIVVCLILFVGFMFLSYLFIRFGIDPFSVNKIQLELHPFDAFVGFFLYFVTAVDYALIVGRMQVSNPGAKARFAMNVFTCVGCFVGVTLVLFLWGFAKEVAWLILPLLVFAGSVMIKLAFEGRSYFEKSAHVPSLLKNFTSILLKVLYYPTRVFTFWIPELGSPRVERMAIKELAKWSFFLPFVIGLDDLIGYMGAMTIYNAFSLLFGIYLADIIIDILIFVSPSFTRKVVESPLLSLLAAYAFVYLAYKSYSESYKLMHEKFFITPEEAVIGFIAFVLVVIAADLIQSYRIKKSGYNRTNEKE